MWSTNVILPVIPLPKLNPRHESKWYSFLLLISCVPVHEDIARSGCSSLLRRLKRWDQLQVLRRSYTLSQSRVSVNQMLSLSIYSLFFHLAALTAGVETPTELFSPLIPEKVFKTFEALPNPAQYPQYTDSSVGKWQYFVPDTWTSGFFPVTAYALNTRKNLCGATPANGLGTADWLTLGRSASNGLIPLETKNSQGHDVGFLSYPFVEELVM